MFLIKGEKKLFALLMVVTLITSCKEEEVFTDIGSIGVNIDTLL